MVPGLSGKGADVTITRRMTLAVGGLLVLMLVLAGIGLGSMTWLHSWTGDFTAAYQSGAGENTINSMLNSLNGGSVLITVIIAVVAALALALGVSAVELLGRMIGRRLRSAVAGIGATVAQLLAVASQVAAAATQTAAATNQTTITVEEVTQTALLVQEKAEEASELTHEVSERCRHGQICAQQNFGRFERIGCDAEVVASAINRLNEQARSVGDIIATVNDLAEQSNLLSVNAAIEAAKAGTYGTGFGVVAQEVKSLAGQSKLAVAQARRILNEIEKASAQAVLAVEESRVAVEGGRTDVGDALEGTAAEVGLASKAAEAAARISATSYQQLAGMEQIRQAMFSINAAGCQSVSGTRQVEEEAMHLRELALSLRQLVDAVPASERRHLARVPVSA
jgi:methyl-accepting chemotaxis protein